METIATTLVPGRDTLRADSATAPSRPVFNPQHRTIHRIVEEQVKRRPEAVAVICDGIKLTYHELNERANQVAHHLQKVGVGPEKLVGVYMERTERTVVAILGILKAGGCYVPIDLVYPQDRVEFILKDSNALA